MKYGVREICDVVLRAKSTQTLGKSTFTKDMPVLYFDSLKTSSLEGAATTVYAQGGRGNSRLIAWEGEKTVTFTMEDALISPVGLAVLSGAGLIEGLKDGEQDNNTGAIFHATETVAVTIKDAGDPHVALTHKPIGSHTVATPSKPDDTAGNKPEDPDNYDTKFFTYIIPLDSQGDIKGQPVRCVIYAKSTEGTERYDTNNSFEGVLNSDTGLETLKNGDLVMIDYYYVGKDQSVTQIDIDVSNFAGNYYLEASTLWRNKLGKDIPAEFIIPNCKIQSNFTFSMAATGDPSTFTFTMDAFPDYTKYDSTKKVLCSIRLMEEDETIAETLDHKHMEVTDLPKPGGAAAYRRSKQSSASTDTITSI